MPRSFLVKKSSSKRLRENATDKCSSDTKCSKSSIENTGKLDSFVFRILCFSIKTTVITLELLETKIAQFENSVALDEVAHKEPPHLELHCLPCSL